MVRLDTIQMYPAPIKPKDRASSNMYLLRREVSAVDEDLLPRLKCVRWSDRKNQNERPKLLHGLILGTVEQYHRALDPLEGNV